MDKLDIVFATTNKGKIKEVKEIMEDVNFNVLSMEDVGVEIEIVEDGETFEENSMKKAIEVSKLCNKIVLADDSGLEIDFLGKAPGIYSARYMGEDVPYEVKNRVILRKMEGVLEEQRTARFLCAMSIVIPEELCPQLLKQERQFTEVSSLEGIIGHEPVGENGFGYDPIFLVKEHNMTTAQMTTELKNQISHRGKVLVIMKERLQTIFGRS